MDQKNAHEAATGAAFTDLWTLPLTLWAGWMQQWFHLAGAGARPHPPVADDDPDQLHVPDPIEDDGEHALFA